jgi:hypothetical protein
MRIGSAGLSIGFVKKTLHRRVRCEIGKLFDKNLVVLVEKPICHEEVVGTADGFGKNFQKHYGLKVFNFQRTVECASDVRFVVHTQKSVSILCINIYISSSRHENFVLHSQPGGVSSSGRHDPLDELQTPRHNLPREISCYC